MGKLITAWDTRTGKERRVPEHWFDHEDLSANLTRTDPGIPQVAPDGVNQAPGPDARDYATTDEIAAAKAAEGELKGKQLDEALEAAGLPKTGKVAEKQARLVEHQERTEVLTEIDRLNTDSIAAGNGQVIEVNDDDTAEQLRGLVEAVKPAPTDSTNGDTNTGAPQPGEK